MNYRIPEYDFGRHGFSTGLAEKNQVEFGDHIRLWRTPTDKYRLELENGNTFAFAPVRELAARYAVAQSRSATIDLDIEIVSCEDRIDGQRMVGTLLGRIRRIKVVSKAGVLAELPTQPTTAPQAGGSDES